MALGAAVKGITIEFEANTTKLGTALKGIENQTKGLDKDLKAVDRALKFNPGNTQLLAQKQQLLGQKIQQTKDKLEQLKKAQATLDDDPAVDKTSQEYMELQREIITTESKLKHFEGEMKKLENIKFEQLGQKFQDVGSKMTQTGQTLTRNVTVPIAGMTAAVVKVGSEFDAQMSKVSALSGATGKELKSLEKLARDMGKQTAFSAKEAGEGLEYMALAGWDTKEMAKGLKPVLDLAASSDIDLGKASDIVTDALSAFGLQAKDAGHFVDVLAKTSTKSNTTVDMLGESFKYAAPAAGAMGYKVEDVNVALGLMANRGIKASSAGTSLRTLLTNMANPTDKMAQAMNDLGVSLDDGNGNMKSFEQVMRDLRKGFGELKMEPGEVKKQLGDLNKALADGSISEKDFGNAAGDLMKRAYGAEGALKAQAAASLAGKTGMSGLLSIVGASDKEFESLVKDLNNADGAANEMSKTMLDNTKGAATIMTSALSEAALTLNDVLAPYARKAAEAITTLANKFAEMPSGVKTVLVVLAGIAAVIGPLLIVFGKMAFGLGAIIKIMPQLMTAFKAVGVAFKALGAVFSANPILLAVMAAIAVGILLWKNWDKVKKVLIKIWDSLSKAVSKAFKTIKKVVSGAWDGIGKAAEKAWGGVKKVIETVVKAIATVIRFYVGIYKTVLSAAWNVIKNVATRTWTAIKNTATRIWKSIKDAITKPIEAAKKAVTNAYNAMKKKVAEKVSASASWVSGVKDKITKAIDGAKKNVASSMDAMKKKVAEKPKVSSAWSGLKDKLSGGVTKAYSAIKSGLDRIKKLFDGLKLKLPKIKVPKFNISGGKAPWGLGGKGTPPKIDITWNKEGGIFKRPTIFATPNGLQGVGEAGAEAVLPLDRLFTEMNGMFNSMADNIVNGLLQAQRLGAAGQGGGGDIHLDVYLYPSGPKMQEAIVRAYDKGKKILG